MANSLTVGQSLTFKTASLTSPITRNDPSVTIAPSGDHFVSGVMDTSTTPAAIPMGSVATAGWCRMKNLDATNDITIRIGSGGADVVKLKANDPAMVFRLAANNPYATASAGTPKLDYMIVEA